MQSSMTAKKLEGKYKINKEIKILGHQWYSRRVEAENIKSIWIYFQGTLHDSKLNRVNCLCIQKRQIIKMFFPSTCYKIPCIWLVLLFFSDDKGSIWSPFSIFHGHTQLLIHMYVHFPIIFLKQVLRCEGEGQMTFILRLVNLLNCPPEVYVVLDSHQTSKLSLVFSDRSWLSAALSRAARLSLSAPGPLGLQVSKVSSLLYITASRQLSLLPKSWILCH